MWRVSGLDWSELTGESIDTFLKQHKLEWLGSQTVAKSSSDDAANLIDLDEDLIELRDDSDNGQVDQNSQF